MADEPTYDWTTAPKEMREAFEKMQADTKELRERDAAASARLAVIDRRGGRGQGREPRGLGRDPP